MNQTEPLSSRVRLALEERAVELKPLVVEHQEIQRVLAAFPSPSQPRTHRSRTTQRSRARRPSAHATRGARQAQLLDLLRVEQATTAELAKKAGITAANASTLLRRLERAGQLARKDGVWHCVASEGGE